MDPRHHWIMSTIMPWNGFYTMSTTQDNYRLCGMPAQCQATACIWIGRYNFFPSEIIYISNHGVLTIRLVYGVAGKILLVIRLCHCVRFAKGRLDSPLRTTLIVIREPGGRAGQVARQAPPPERMEPVHVRSRTGSSRRYPLSIPGLGYPLGDFRTRRKSRTQWGEHSRVEENQA